MSKHGGCRWPLLCKLFVLFLLLYALGHWWLFGHHDPLDWMPPPADLSFVTDSPRKKHPDGPLVLGDGILLVEQTEGGGKKALAKAVPKEEGSEQFGIQIREEAEEQTKQQGTAKRRKSNKLPISEHFLAKLRHSAKQIQQRRDLPRGFVLFNVINRAYGDMAQNWLCNLYSLPSSTNSTAADKKKAAGDGNTELLRAVLLVALDGGELCKELHKAWPQDDVKMDADEQKAVDEPLSWGRLRYVQILTTRANMMAALAEAQVPFVLAESDAVWLRNPFDELFPKADSLEDADIVVPFNSGPASAKGQPFAFDPMVAFGTNGTRRMLQEMRRVLNSQPGKMDQELLNELCSAQYAGVVCRQFESTEVADGAWFKLADNERARAAQQAGHWPLVVNNNFYVGVHNKMARQAINGLWFLSTKQKQCNLAKTKRILGKFEKA